LRSSSLTSSQRREARDEIRDIHQALGALAAREELVLRTRDAVNVQSYVRGRIAQYLETTEDAGDLELTHQVVTQLGGSLQLIALDHADFEDQWFAESVVERWRGGGRAHPAWMATRRGRG
jgi:hypothetical protein